MDLAPDIGSLLDKLICYHSWVLEHGVVDELIPHLDLAFGHKYLPAQLQNDFSVLKVLRDGFGYVIDRVGHFQLKVQFLHYLVVVVDQVAILVEEHVIPLLKALESHGILRLQVDHPLPLEVLSDVRSLGQTLGVEGPAFHVVVTLVGCCNTGDSKRQKLVLVGGELADDLLHSDLLEDSEHQSKG